MYFLSCSLFPHNIKFCRFLLHGMGSGSAKEYIKHLLPPTTLASYIQYSMDTSSRMAGWWSEVCNFSIQLQLCLPAIPLGLEFSHPNHTHKTFSKLSSTHIFIIATSFSLSREGPQSLRRLKRRFVPLACFFPQAAPLYITLSISIFHHCKQELFSSHSKFLIF